ncbi:MAG: hypothetical protein ACPLXS_02360 [Candidatus Micrarchaeales archaeon]|jgi:hypothetical protein
MSFEKEVGEKGEGKKKEVRFPELLKEKEKESSAEFKIKEIREEKKKRTIKK